jgi:hypothetical protein
MSSSFASLACLGSLVACSGGTTTGTTARSSTTGTESAALLAAESSASTYETQASQCATAFQTCVSEADAGAAGIAACVAQLQQCLPTVPPPGPGCGAWADGGVPTPPPPPDGGLAIPPPASGAMDGDGGCDGHGGPPGDGHGPPPVCGHVPLPSSTALEACRTTLESCMKSATDDTARDACREAHHECVQSAFEAAL